MYPGRMGGRKFKLGRSHKNYERKRLRSKKNKPGRPKKMKRLIGAPARTPPVPSTPPQERPNEPSNVQKV
jgi:hypothetical protein